MPDESARPAMRIVYIVVTTNAKHFTDERNGALLLAAIERGDKVAEIDLDLQGDGLTIRTVKLVLAHFVMLIDCAEAFEPLAEFEEIVQSNVTHLRPRTARGER
jgi:hypothetical protein